MSEQGYSEVKALLPNESGRAVEHATYSTVTTRRMKHRYSLRRRILGLTALQLVAVIVIALGITLAVTFGMQRPERYINQYSHAAVATDAAICSQVGVDILKKGGSAVDAAIASLLCVGVINLQSTGIGGGGFMLYYNASSGESTVIDFRETAPGVISEEAMEQFKNNPDSTVYGGLAIGVPGEVRGMGEAWNKFGVLEWKELFQPSIKLAREGFRVTPAVATAIQRVKEHLNGGNYDGLKEILAPNGNYLKEGDTLRNEPLAKTLEDIANNGADYFYDSEFTEQMVKELQDDFNCLLTVDDFKSYKAVVRESIVSHYKGMDVHGVPPPASGAAIALMLNILKDYDLTLEDDGLSYHRIIESFKFSYAQRSRLGDPEYNSTVKEVLKYMLDDKTADIMRSRLTDNTTHDPEYYTDNELYIENSHGTTHLVVQSENGDAVSVTSTINLRFGSLVRSKQNGILFNNEMDDFGVPGRNNSFGYPPSPPNYIEPGKRPLSSTVPTILVKDGKVVMVVGAAGGSQIPTSTCQTILDINSLEMSLAEAIVYPRIHHQLIPNIVLYEPTFPEVYRDGLQKRGHQMTSYSEIAVVQAISYDTDTLTISAESDPRKGGKPAGY